MGRNNRPAPPQMGKKLTAIRTHLSVSQSAMLALVKPGMDKRYRAVISEYERGAKAPDYPALLRYARLVGVSTDVLIDDALELILQPVKQSSPPPPPSRASFGTEQLTVAAPAGMLDIIDNVYLELLWETPRALRPHLTRNCFHRTVIGTSVADYLESRKANSLLANWQRLIQKTAARVAGKTADGDEAEAK